MKDAMLLASRMVDEQLRNRGIGDERVLSAMETVPRHLFMPPDVAPFAYEDRALPIGEDQTISQPYMVAIMTSLLRLKGAEKVLEIGTGSGYQAAVLSRLSRSVYTVERIPALFERARKTLADLGYDNVHAYLSDGTLGLPEEAPFDAIVVTAAAPDVPEPLKHQLSEGGRLVVPVGTRYLQSLAVLVRHGKTFDRSETTPCVFVPLIGMHGFAPTNA